MTVFITDTRLGRQFTSLRREFFGSDFPASALICVHSLMPVGALIEIQATRCCPDQSTLSVEFQRDIYTWNSTGRVD